MRARDITLEWANKAEEDAAVALRESRVRKQPSPGAVCYHAQQCIEKYLKAVLQEMGRPIPKSSRSSSPHALIFSLQPPARIQHPGFHFVLHQPGQHKPCAKALFKE
jgi:hypothetical protein